MREQEGKQEDERKDRRNGADILVFTRAQFDDRVGNETSRDAVRNGIRKGHHGDGQERGDSRRGVFPIDIDDVSHHQNADVHQSARRSRAGDELRDGTEEHCDCEEERDHQRGKARSAAFGHARRDVYKRQEIRRRPAERCR